MPDKRELELTNCEEETLTEMRDHHPKPYMRERAAALLKIPMVRVSIGLSKKDYYDYGIGQRLPTGSTAIKQTD